MKNLFQNNFRIVLFFVAFSMLNGLSPASVSHAQNITGIEGLNRVGPIDPSIGYPLWYEDKSGLKLQVCLDLDNCFIEPPNPLLPLHMPTTTNDPAANFPDEVFYYAAESIFAGVSKGDRAVLVQALEGMFFSDAGVVINDQAVMSRIRIRIDNLQVGEDYTVIYPYGIETFTIEGDAGPGAAKGPGISMTRDIGLVEPLFFEGPLKGDIGPFLIPVGYTGGPFIADGGLTEVEVTGSPLNKGVNTNVFRIEGPGVALIYPANRCAPDRMPPVMAPLGPNPVGPDDCVESFHFSVMGQIASKFGANIDRATYTKENGDIYVNVWANTVEGQALVASVDGGPAMNLTEDLAGNYFGRLSVPAGQIPKTVVVTNTTDQPATSESRAITDELIIKEASYVVGQGLSIAVQSSNLVDPPSMTATLTTGQAAPVVFNLTDQGNGLSTGTTAAPGGLTEEHPPLKVVVKSGYAGSAETKVIVLGTPTSGGLMNGILAIAGADQNVIADGKTVVLNGADSLGPLALTYTWTHDDTTGAISLIDPTSGLSGVNSAQTSFVTPTLVQPLPGGKLTVNFTLTVSDGTNTDTDMVTVNMVQPQVLPVDTCAMATDANPLGLVHPPGAPRYRENREKWIVEGSCDLAENQVISVYLGNDIAPDMTRLIGVGRVNALGNWEVAPGNRSAVAGVTIPSFDPEERDPKTPLPPTTKVWAISSRGSIAVSDFTIN